MENEIFEFIEVHSSASLMVHLLQQFDSESFLNWDLKFNEHFLKFIKTQKIVFVDIEFVEKLFQDEFLMGAFSPLNQLESNEFYGAFDLFGFDLFIGHVRHSPLRIDESDEGLIVGDVQTQIVVEIEKLFLSHISFGSEW